MRVGGRVDDQAADESAERHGDIRNTVRGKVVRDIVQVGELHYHVWHRLLPLLDRAGSNYLTDSRYQPGEDNEARRADLAERIARLAIHNPGELRAAMNRPVDTGAAVPDDPDRFDEAIALLMLVEQRLSEQRIVQQANTDVTERIAVELTQLRLVVARQLAAEPVEQTAEPVGDIDEIERPAPGECPYPGLTAFAPHQAQWFFGREKLIAKLLRRLAMAQANGTPLFVVGVSGVGKSSLLRAGLVPALIRGDLPVPGSADW